MPDMPQQGGGAPAPQQGAPGGQGQQPGQGGQSQGGQGGGIADAIVAVDTTMAKIAQAVAQNQQLDDDVKSAWQDALAALRKAEKALTDALSGGGDNDGDEGGGAVAPEQGGAKGAVPMTHAPMRGQ